MTIKKTQRNDNTDDIEFTPEGYQAASDAFAAWLVLNPPLETPEVLARLRASAVAYAETGRY